MREGTNVKNEGGKLTAAVSARWDTYMVQDVVPFLAGGDLNELAQEERGALGDGGQFANVLGLALEAVDLPTQKTITHIINDPNRE